MAQLITLASIVAKVRSYADLVANDFRTDAQIGVFIQARAEKLREELLKAGGHKLFATPMTATTVAGTQEVSLVALAPAAVQVVAVDLLLSGTDWVPLEEASFDDRYTWGTDRGRPEAWVLTTDKVMLLPIPDASYSVIVWYTPAQGLLSDGAPIVKLDAVHGWDEYVAWGVAQDLKALQDLDWSYQDKRTREELDRIKRMARNRTTSAQRLTQRRYPRCTRRSFYVR